MQGSTIRPLQAILSGQFVTLCVQEPNGRKRDVRVEEY
jgi:hypothetical protein